MIRLFYFFFNFLYFFRIDCFFYLGKVCIVGCHFLFVYFIAILIGSVKIVCLIKNGTFDGCLPSVNYGDKSY